MRREWKDLTTTSLSSLLSCNDLTFFSASDVLLVFFLFSIVFVVGVLLLIVCFAFFRWSKRSERKSASSRARIEEPTTRVRECFSASTLYLTMFSLIKHFIDGVFLFMENIENYSFFLCATFCCVLGFREVGTTEDGLFSCSNHT
jgi:hypothetical protein